MPSNDPPTDAQATDATHPLPTAAPAAGISSSTELFDSEMNAGQGAVEEGGHQENRAAQPTAVNPPPTAGLPPLSKPAGSAPPRPAAQPGSGPATATSSKSLANSETSVRKGAVEPGGQQENRAASPPAAASGPRQPNAYGGNFGNDVQNSYQDQGRADNQKSDANRGEFGEQGALGATHGGYGNQNREFDTAAERPAAEATEEKYYGEGAAAPGPQHNAYRDYDGHDQRPEQQGHAVRDTPAPPTPSLDEPGASHPAAPDGQGHGPDNRNLPDKSGEVAAFQNDNGAPTVGTAYAADYGHTSGVGLPAATPDNHAGTGVAGRNQQEDQHSSRGGYDNQGSQGGRSHDQQPGGNAPTGAPAAQQNPGNPDTGDSRNGFGAGGSREGNTSQGYGSKGGSYDDQNPGAHGPAYDALTQQDKARNYGQENRESFRPAGGDQPQDADDTAPHRPTGHDEPAQ